MFRKLTDEEVTTLFGTREERLARDARMKRQLQFFWEHRAEWSLKYPAQFVVIHDEVLVAKAKDFDELEKVLCELTVPRSEVLIEQVGSSREILMPSLFPVAE